MNRDANVRCLDCDQPIDPERDFRHVDGWEKRRSRGLNGLVLTHHTGEWLCRPCMTLRRQQQQTSGTTSMF